MRSIGVQEVKLHKATATNTRFGGQREAVLFEEHVVLGGELKGSSYRNSEVRVMKKKVTGVIVILLLVWIAAYSAPASKAADGMSSPIGILSPIHQAYTCSSPIVLKTMIVGLGGSNVFYSMAYSLDGQANVTLPFTTQTHERSFQITMTGQTILPKLAEGTHNITVYQRLEIDYHSATPTTTILWDSDSVNFTVDDQKLPAIEKISIENKTYSQNSLQLNYPTLDEPTSWIGYSLDNQNNVTIGGNTTLTDITVGSHSIQIFANDTVGNMAAMNTTYFAIARPTSNSDFNQAILIVVAGIIAISAVVGLIFFKKRMFKAA